jgi:hypothetical protein
MPVYGNGVGEAISRGRSALEGVYPVDPEVVVALAIQGDGEALAQLVAGERDRAKVESLLQAAGGQLSGPAVYRIAFERRRVADDLLAGAYWTGRPVRWTEPLGRLLSPAHRPWSVLISISGSTSLLGSSVRHAGGSDRDRAVRAADRPCQAPVQW